MTTFHSKSWIVVDAKKFNNDVARVLGLLEQRGNIGLTNREVPQGINLTDCLIEIKRLGNNVKRFKKGRKVRYILKQEKKDEI